MIDRVCRNKFANCVHTKEILLKSKSELAECTSILEWGTGLDMKKTIETLPDFWLGKNLLG